MLDRPPQVEMLKFVEWHSEFMEKGLYDIYAIHGTWNATALRLMEAQPTLPTCILMMGCTNARAGVKIVKKEEPLEHSKFLPPSLYCTCH